MCVCVCECPWLLSRLGASLPVFCGFQSMVLYAMQACSAMEAAEGRCTRAGLMATHARE